MMLRYVKRTKTSFWLTPTDCESLKGRISKVAIFVLMADIWTDCFAGPIAAHACGVNIN